MDNVRPIAAPWTADSPDGRLARTLGAIVTHAGADGAVRKTELEPGDRVIVKTRNSVYHLEFTGGETFVVSGGWFDRQSAPLPITINGCTYGGSTIRHDVVAGRGLFLEFGNNVTTTRIQDVRVVRPQAVLTHAPDLPC